MSLLTLRCALWRVTCCYYWNRWFRRMISHSYRWNSNKWSTRLWFELVHISWYYDYSTDKHKVNVDRCPCKMVKCSDPGKTSWSEKKLGICQKQLIRNLTTVQLFNLVCETERKTVFCPSTMRPSRRFCVACEWNLNTNVMWLACNNSLMTCFVLLCFYWKIVH